MNSHLVQYGLQELRANTYVILTGALQAIKKIGKSDHIITSEDFTSCIHTLLWLWYLTHQNFLSFHTQTHLTDLLLLSYQPRVCSAITDFHLATRLCTCPVCDVSLCSHSVPSGGFNSLAETQAKNKSPL
jgi:hypothetical protein